MRVGTATVDITPPVGTWLVGYLDREAVSDSVADPLRASALALSSDTDTFVLVSCDVLALHSSVVAIAREHICAATAIPPASVWVGATHTHSGPPTHPSPEINELERSYIDELPRRIAEAALLAIGDLQPAEIRYASVVSDLGANRRRLVNGVAAMEPAIGRPIDDALSILDIRHEDGTQLALLAVLGCHPVTVGRNNLTVSADYPGALCRLLEDALGGRVIFCIGAAGDVNPRFGPVPDSSGARDAATSLLAPIYAARDVSDPLATGSVRVTHRILEFLVSPSPIDNGPDTPPQIEHLVQLAGLTWKQIDQVMDRRAPWQPVSAGDYHQQDRTIGELSAARVGSVALVGLPFEAFSMISNEIKRRSPFPNTVVLGQMNGALGYLAPGDEHPYGGYEVCESSLFYRTRGPLSPAAAELVIEESLAMLTELADEEKL